MKYDNFWYNMNVEEEEQLPPLPEEINIEI